MSNAELKPCPFCGGQAELQAEKIESEFTIETYYRVSCAECLCSMGEYVYANHAVEAWNRRVYNAKS